MPSRLSRLAAISTPFQRRHARDVARARLASAARRSNEGRRAAEHSCPTAVGAGAPATRGAAAELVDELVEDMGEAGSDLTNVR